MGLRDWVSEKAPKSPPTMNPESNRFNGAPRLGLGEGDLFLADLSGANLLQWGSETGSRRRR